MKMSMRRHARFAAGLARAAGLVALMFGLALTQALRSAEARMGEALRTFGDELMAWHGLRMHSGERRLSVNGLQVRLVAASTTESVREVLDHVALRCRAGLRDGVFRRESEGEGVIGCIDTGGPLAMEELGRRLAAVVHEGDLHALGGLRYVVARRSGDTTVVLLLWTAGSFPLLRAFPGSGDAPGVDPSAVPRPHAARRILSAAESGAPYSITAYEMASASSTALAAYEQILEEQGWAVRAEPEQGVLVARRATRTLLVRVGMRTSGRTVITLAVLS